MQRASEHPQRPTNDVFSDTFESKLDQCFKADFDNTYKWAPGAASRPRMIEIGMIWSNKVTKKLEVPK